MGKTPILSALALAIATSAIMGSMAYAEENVSVATESNTEIVAMSATVDVSTSNIASLREQVRRASENTSGNKVYRGLSAYLSKLASYEYEIVSDQQEYANALDSAIRAANLLSGRDVTVESTATGNGKSARSADVSETTVAASDTATTAQTSNNVANARAVTEPVSTTVAETNVTQPVVQNTIQTTVAKTTDTQPTATLATAVKITVASPEQVVAQSDDIAVKNYDDQGTAVDDELTNKDESNIMPEVTPELPKTGEIESNLGILIAAGVAVVVIVLGSTAIILKSKNKRLEK